MNVADKSRIVCQEISSNLWQLLNYNACVLWIQCLFLVPFHVVPLQWTLGGTQMDVVFYSWLRVKKYFNISCFATYLKAENSDEWKIWVVSAMQRWPASCRQCSFLIQQSQIKITCILCIGMHDVPFSNKGIKVWLLYYSLALAP